MKCPFNPNDIDSARLCIALRTIATGLIVALVISCSTPSFVKRPPFIKASFKPDSPRVITKVNLQVTPRELLTARLINPPVDENTPQITVGKLIEFADRYLSCDCSGLRFVKSWQRLPGSYRLTTNSEFASPLEFFCLSDDKTTNCHLSEIDRGEHIQNLGKRFIPGAQFIQFMYQNGLQCDRETPCSPDDP
ncbi:MAG TPA: hypothetical protein DGR97_00165 [Gammaproteobacteria bacterium]|nr:hypothetical protein [Gammaproteobacteria bacterium]|tara:strand:+ start:2316 stop:2891 length:576 start_codon:yes stop_codon:yes gene_type:complete